MRPTIIVSLITGIFVISLNFAAELLSSNAGQGSIVYPFAYLLRAAADLALLLVLPTLLVRKTIRRAKADQRFWDATGEIQTIAYIEADSPQAKIGDPQAGWRTLKPAQRETPPPAAQRSGSAPVIQTNYRLPVAKFPLPRAATEEGVLLSNIKLARRRNLSR